MTPGTIISQLRIDRVDGKRVFCTCQICGKPGVIRTIESMRQVMRGSRECACKMCLTKARKAIWSLPGRRLFLVARGAQ